MLFLALPLAALLLQTPWGSLVGIAGSPTALAALRLSLLTSVAATLVAVNPSPADSASIA